MQLTSRGWSRVGWWGLLPGMLGLLSGLVGGGWWLAPFGLIVWWFGTIPWWRLSAHARGRADLHPRDPLWIALLAAGSFAGLPLVVLRRSADVGVGTLTLVAVLLVLPGLAALVAALRLQDAITWRPGPVVDEVAGVATRVSR